MAANGAFILRSIDTATESELRRETESIGDSGRGLSSGGHRCVGGGRLLWKQQP